MPPLRPLPDRLPSRVPLHPEEEALLRGCLSAPWDDPSFLVYADWLDDHGQAERAEFVRAQLRDGSECDLGDAPDAIRQWAMSIFGDVLCYSLPFIRGLPGAFYLWEEAFEDRTIRAVAGWAWRCVWMSERPECIRPLAESPLLSGIIELSVQNCRLEDPDFVRLFESPHLRYFTSLDVSSNRFWDRSQEALGKCSWAEHLTHLNLENTGATGWFLIENPNFNNLRFLDFYSAEMYEGNAIAILQTKHFSSLRHLGLGCNQLDNTVVEALARCTHLSNLVSLDLCNNSCIEGGAAEVLAAIPHLSNLRLLDLRETGLGKADEEVLKQSPYLKNCEFRFGPMP
jgi:uncharacterized protein (TIGR02996 family)